MHYFMFYCQLIIFYYIYALFYVLLAAEFYYKNKLTNINKINQNKETK